MAFFIMNVFHAWQYFALIWWSERKTLTRLVGREGRTRAGAAALTLLLGTGLAYGPGGGPVQRRQQLDCQCLPGRLFDAFLVRRIYLVGATQPDLALFKFN